MSDEASKSSTLHRQISSSCSSFEVESHEAPASNGRSESERSARRSSELETPGRRPASDWTNRSSVSFNQSVDSLTHEGARRLPSVGEAQGDDSPGDGSVHGSQGSSGASKNKDGNMSGISPTHSLQKLTAYRKADSLKEQKKHYRDEKKKAAKELLLTLKNPTIIVMAEWLKVRGTLKGWTKLWCVLKPGLIVLYKSQKLKSGSWVGTVLLSMCELIERPSKKDGFCFKVFHPLDQSIWATRGPKGETIGAITQPLPASYIIFRAPSDAAGRTWMDALELSCSSLLTKPITNRTPTEQSELPAGHLLKGEEANDSLSSPRVRTSNSSPLWKEEDLEKHFEDHGLADTEEGKDERSESESRSGSESEDEEDDTYNESFGPSRPVDQTTYCENASEDLGLLNGESQSEEVNDDNKSIIWSLVKQVRPGMDLSKVVLPTFILEPRSFLDKLSDYYYHADLLRDAVVADDPYSRLQQVVRWYVSGFYKKPRGPKKPYNPILGETFRCLWRHPSGSRTFYIAEQISHHPPVSAFYVTNRQDGFCLSGSLLAKSKFYGNSVSAVMEGAAKLTLLPRGEDYICTMPYGHCKGILVGTLTMELGGKVSITCEKTGYSAELEFKLKKFFSGSEQANRIGGKLKLGNETLATMSGHWDGTIYITDKKTAKTEVFFEPDTTKINSRLRRSTVPIECQEKFESERVWQNVTASLKRGDDKSATDEKYLVEGAQRQSNKERQLQGVQWQPRFFEQDPTSGDWLYRYADSRPWDAMNDVLQYEQKFIIQTKTNHKTPLVRAMSIMSVSKDKKTSNTSVAPSTGVTQVEENVKPVESSEVKSELRRRVTRGSPVITEAAVPSTDDLNRTYSDEMKRLRDEFTMEINSIKAQMRPNLHVAPIEWLILAVLLFLQATVIGIFSRT